MGESKRKEITKMLSLSVQKYISPRNDTRIYWAKEVTFDYGTKNAKRVDFMRFKPVNNKEIPYGVGVLIPSSKSRSGDWYSLKSIKKAKRRDRTKSISEMLLMMFRSAARDRKPE